VFWLRIERLNRNTRTVLYFAIPYLKQRGGRRRFMEGPALLAGSGRSDRYRSRRNPANFQRDVTIQPRGAGENPAASPENSAATVFQPVTSQPSSSLTRLSCRRPTSKTIRRRSAICSLPQFRSARQEPRGRRSILAATTEAAAAPAKITGAAGKPVTCSRGDGRWRGLSDRRFHARRR
jgi:hypothetical protein